MSRQRNLGWIGAGDIALALGISRPTVGALLRTGRLPVRHWRNPGGRGHWRVDRGEWQVWLRHYGRGMTPEAKRKRLLWRRQMKRAMTITEAA